MDFLMNVMNVSYYWGHIWMLWIINKYELSTLQIQTLSETVFDMVFWGVNTSSEGIWSTREIYNQ